MKFSIVNGEKREPQKGLSGVCPNCGSPTISKCGNKKIHHWAHKSKLECDPWWENETEWHRDWKNHFHINWQEVVHKDEVTGEKHIADVKTDQGWIIEFQHSYIRPEERKARNVFYKKIAWVVDGNRLKGDLDRIKSAIENGKFISPHIIKVKSDFCSLLKDWASENIPVFFDFGGPQLVLLFPDISDGFYYITTSISKNQFIEIFREPGSPNSIEFMSLLKNFKLFISQLNNPKPQTSNIMSPQLRKIRRGPRIDYIQKRRGRKF